MNGFSRHQTQTRRVSWKPGLLQGDAAGGPLRRTLPFFLGSAYVGAWHSGQQMTQRAATLGKRKLTPTTENLRVQQGLAACSVGGWACRAARLDPSLQTPCVPALPFTRGAFLLFVLSRLQPFFE